MDGGAKVEKVESGMGPSSKVIVSCTIKALKHMQTHHALAVFANRVISSRPCTPSCIPNLDAFRVSH